METYCARILVFSYALINLCVAAAEPTSLTLRQAHEAALRTNPRITVAQLNALASRQVERQARAGFLPNISANMVAVGTADENTRLAAIGALNNPAIFDRAAAGVMVSQLITDFGRTLNLSRTANYRARAQEQNALATRAEVLLAVDTAYFSALQAEAVTRVAQQTVAARQVFLDQVTALASNKFRSDLDVSFAKVNLEDAQLLLTRSRNDLDAAFAQLATLVGYPEVQSFRLAEEPLPPELSTNVSAYVQDALRSRPDVERLRNEREAALRFARAEGAARFPTVAAVGSAGGSAVHEPQLEDGYAAGGVVLNVPLYAGGLYKARQQEAELRARAVTESLRDYEDNVIRDVRIAWLSARNALDRRRIAEGLLQNARQSLELAQARYANGISSIVEFNQAQLNAVAAEIAFANAQYEYLLQRSNLSFQTGSLR